ncbi:MAG: FHA domain-containing protein [Leptolyngbyaceae cyanobacterium MO_188.B28]|nr:FHA domain-containing protein [Leptolyngbyaceae cyanobacterium MO_188.B28]
MSTHEAANPKLHVLIVEDSKGRQEFILDSTVYSVGRDPRCDIRLDSQFVSRHHATLVQQSTDGDGCRYRIFDGNLEGKASVNGIMINGRRLKSHDLNNADEIVFGPQAKAFYFELQRDPTLVPVNLDEFDITLISPSGMPNIYEDLDG